MSENTVIFYYGALGDTLEVQANKQGYTLGTNAEICEKIRKSITMCMFHVAIEAQIKSMTTKLHNRVMKSLIKM